MKILIAGCGKIGVAILQSMLDEGHDVTVIDSSNDRLHEITDVFDVMGVCGNTADFSVLQEAGAGEADVFISVTGSDELNLRIGLRETAFTPEGFLVNGERVQLRGVCVHQDIAGFICSGCIKRKNINTG